MPRGGRRTGSPGSAYSNRTDLNANRTLPIQVGPSQQYGQAAAQTRAQQAVPMAPPPASSTPNAPPAAPAAAPLVPLDAPTARPNEPVTAGAALGAGPGPMAMGAPAATWGELLQQATKAPFASSELVNLAAFINQGRT